MHGSVIGLVLVVFRLHYAFGNPRLISYRIEKMDDVQFDEKQSIFVTYVGHNTLVSLFGFNLTVNTLVALTPHTGDNSSCLNSDRIGTTRINKSYQDDTIAEITLNIPGYITTGKFIFCFSSDGATWIEQGQDKWQSIGVEVKILKKTILPLWFQIIIIIILLCSSGLFSGLNIGLMSLDKTELQILENSGTDRERSYAKTVKSVRHRGNYLLCTILLGNVMVNNTLAILMDDLTGSGAIAVVVSTLCIVLFGEIIPQAICSRYGLAIGAKTIWFTWIFMVVTFPLSFPVSKILDLILGEEMGSVYNRDRLRELLKITQADTDLIHDEVNIITGALEFTKKTALDVMTKMDDVFMVDMNRVLDFETMTEIVKSGFTRIPVYENDKTNIVGLLNVKDLAFVDPDDKIKLTTLCKFYNRPVQFVFGDTRLDQLLAEFKQGRCHMSMVQVIHAEGPGDPYYEIVGLVTLEDVLEEIIQAEIMDETDVITDNRKRMPRKVVDRDFSVFHVVDDDNCERMAPQLALAAYQFLTTSVQPFRVELISETILQRLLRQNVLVRYLLNSSPEVQAHIYVKGKPCDFFTMILEGRVQVDIGQENITFEGGPFSFYGINALIDPEKTTSFTSLTNDAAYSHTNTYVPDYSVTAISNLLYLRIRSAHYIAARRATLIEQATGNSSSHELLPSPRVKIAEEAFSKEWQKALKANQAEDELAKSAFNAAMPMNIEEEIAEGSVNCNMPDEHEPMLPK